VDNLEFSYLYRDGGNHKKWGRVVFSNPERASNESVKRRLRQTFLQDGLFIANQIRVPDVFLYAEGQFSFDDHCYHEFDETRPTAKEADDVHRRTITEFLAEITQQGELGWEAFDPYDSDGSLGHYLTSRVRRT
jgi:hypothetical protein